MRPLRMTNLFLLLLHVPYFKGGAREGDERTAEVLRELLPAHGEAVQV